VESLFSLNLVCDYFSLRPFVLVCDGQIPVAVKFCEKRAEFFVVTGRTACTVDAHNGVLKKEFNHIMNHEISACAIDPDVNKVRSYIHMNIGV
jgi:hypothetical protein